MAYLNNGLLAIVGFFLLGLMKEIKSNTEGVKENTLGLTELKGYINNMSDKVQHIKESTERKTTELSERINEVEEDVEFLEFRSHTHTNKLIELDSLAKNAGWKTTDEWKNSQRVSKSKRKNLE